MKTEISEEDYLKLVGLYTIAQHHNKALQEIELAVADVIEMEPKEGFGGNYFGHVSDAIWDFDMTLPGETLRKLKITVKKKA